MESYLQNFGVNRNTSAGRIQRRMTDMAPARITAKASDSYQTSSEHQHRVRYVVKDGDTLDLIAEQNFADVRFAPLIITINRAEIIFTVVNGKTTPKIYAGQILWMPTDFEREVHRKHFFTKRPGTKSGVTASTVVRNAITPTQIEVAPELVRQEEAATVLSSKAIALALPAIAMSVPQSNNAMAAALHVLRFAGNRQCLSLDTLAKQLPKRSERGFYQVRLGDTLQSIASNDPLMKDLHLWTLIARINNLSCALDVLGRPKARLTRGEYILLPNAGEVEEYRLLQKLIQIEQLAGRESSPIATAPGASASGDSQKHEELLSNFCRLVVVTASHSTYSIKLQARMNGQWATVACYQCGLGAAVRHTYKLDGSRNCLDVGLPAKASRELAIEDFRRNWQFYYSRYLTSSTALTPSY